MFEQLTPEQKTQAKTAVALLLLLTSLSGASFIHSVNAENQWAQLFGPALPSVWIYSNGTFTSTDLPIQQDGNVYYLTGDIYKHAIHIDCDNVVLDGRNFSIKSDGSLGGAAISISAYNVTVKNFVIDTVPVGVTFYGTAGLVGEEMDATIINNTIAHCNVAIKCWGPSANSFRENVLENNKIGLEIKGEYYSNGQSFSRGYACFNIVEKNIIRYNDEGLHLEDANQSRIRQNVMFQNLYGASLNNVDGTVFQKNEFKANRYGVHIIAPSSNNQFSLNNFDGNSEAEVLLDGNQTQNAWDDGSAGNFWRYYDGSGVYLIDENNVDHYPLTQPVDIYSEPPAELGDSNQEIYMVTIVAVAIVVAAVFVFLIRKRKRKLENTF